MSFLSAPRGVQRHVKPLLVVLFLLAACRKEGASTVSLTSDAATATRIVRTAEIRIVVPDTSRAVEAVTGRIESAGGYVSSSSIWREGDSLRARLTLHVPADELTSTLAAIRRVAKRVEGETIRSHRAEDEASPQSPQLAVPRRKRS